MILLEQVGPRRFTVACDEHGLLSDRQTEPGYARERAGRHLERDGCDAVVAEVGKLPGGRFSVALCLPDGEGRLRPEPAIRRSSRAGARRLARRLGDARGGAAELPEQLRFAAR